MLGVSPQAVSRWEANGCYPDMDLIPAIANYFNVSIDELFGYSREREAKLNGIIEKADRMLDEQGDMTECVEMLRAAAEEFPSESKILIRLGYALNFHGWKKYGARSYTKEGSDYALEDTEYNSGNVYWQEEIKVFEKALAMDIPPQDRDTIINMMVTAYAKMGYNEKAKALAEKQDSINVCRECLMPKATEAEERDKYQGEAIIALLSEMNRTIFYLVYTKLSVLTKHEGVALLLSLAALYESVFSDGNCGLLHSDIAKLYFRAAILEAKFGQNIEKAFEHFKRGYEHHRKFKAISGSDSYQYTAPVVEKVVCPINITTPKDDASLNTWTEHFPQSLIDRIKADGEYSECFGS